IWERLNTHGLSTGLANLPLTYPAPPVNGFVISGFNTPFETIAPAKGHLFPDRQLVARLLKQASFPIFRSFDVNVDRNLDQHIDEWIRDEAVRVEAALTAYGEFGSDFFAYATHIAAYFHHIVRKNDHALKRVYQSIDKTIGRLMGLIGADSNLILFSDHGAQE